MLLIDAFDRCWWHFWSDNATSRTRQQHQCIIVCNISNHSQCISILENSRLYKHKKQLHLVHDFLTSLSNQKWLYWKTNIPFRSNLLNSGSIPRILHFWDDLKFQEDYNFWENSIFFKKDIDSSEWNLSISVNSIRLPSLMFLKYFSSYLSIPVHIVYTA